jgi:Fungal Zn(2)-Cys(6) binuclear cluster domain
MAVVTARRVVKPERVGKHRFGKSLAQTTGFLLENTTNRMSEHFQLHVPTTFESIPVLSPSFTTRPDVTGGATGAEALTKKRKASKSKIPTELRRAVSTPHMRGLTMSDPGGISPGVNKPRNKLGYHRTSVACGEYTEPHFTPSQLIIPGHCRRRKIRCLLPSPEDPQGRCANCIRLKKECNFYPVTEAGQHERAGKKGVVSGAVSASDPASPRQSGSSNAGSSGEELQGILHLPPQASTYQPATQSEPYSLPQVNGCKQ